MQARTAGSMQPLDQLLVSIAKNPTIGVVGLASWDTVLAIETMPSPGGYSMVTQAVEQPGGTSANAAAAAAALGAQVGFISAVGDDDAGKRLLAALTASGVDCSRVRVDPFTPTDQTTVISSQTPRDRTIFWREGAVPRRGDRIDIDWLFTRNLVLLDSVDPLLRRFLIDLPVHTFPDAKILVPMTYAVDFPGQDELDSIVRCDALVGSGHELMRLTGTDSIETAISSMQARMRTSNLRSVAVTLGAEGALAFDQEQVHRVAAVPVEVVDPTGAGDAFAGAFAVALACRLPIEDALTFANVVAGLSVRSLGAQTGLPSIAVVAKALSSWTRAQT